MGFAVSPTGVHVDEGGIVLTIFRELKQEMRWKVNLEG